MNHRGLVSFGLVVVCGLAAYNCKHRLKKPDELSTVTKEEALKRLRDGDAAALGAYTLKVEATVAPMIFGIETSSRIETATLSSDGKTRARDAAVKYAEPPVYRERDSVITRPGDHDAEGNLLVVRLLRSRIAAGPEVHDLLEEYQLVAVSPEGEASPMRKQIVVARETLDTPPRLVAFDLLLMALGRGYAAHLDQVIEVSEDGGRLRLRAAGSFFPAQRKGEWRLTVDPEAGYLVREATFFDAGSEVPEFEASSSGLARDGASSVATTGSAIIPGLREDKGPSLSVTVSSYRAAPDAALIAATVEAVTAPAPEGAIEEGPRVVEIEFKLRPDICCRCRMVQVTRDECLHLTAFPCPSPPHPAGSLCTDCLGPGVIPIPATDGGVHRRDAARVCIHNEVSHADCQITGDPGDNACTMSAGTPIRQSLRPLAADCPNAGSTDANDVRFETLLEYDRTCAECQPGNRQPAALVACDDPQPACGGADFDAQRRAGQVCDF